MVAATCAWASRASFLPPPARTLARWLVSPAPLSPLAGWGLLALGAVAPHRAFVTASTRVIVRIARVPRIRRILRRKWPIWGKLLLKNKMRAEVTSYRLAVNEAWEALEGTLPSETLNAMREAESNVVQWGDDERAEGTDAGDEEGDAGAGSNSDEDAPSNDARARRVAASRRASPPRRPLARLFKPRGADPNQNLGDREPRRLDRGSKPKGGKDGASDGFPTYGRFRGGNKIAKAGNTAASGSSAERGSSSRGNAILAPLARVGHFTASLSRRVLVTTLSQMYGVLVGREFGAELHAPSPESDARLAEAIDAEARREKGTASPEGKTGIVSDPNDAAKGGSSSLSSFAAFGANRAHRAAFSLQYGGGGLRKTLAAMKKSAAWRDERAREGGFLAPRDLRRFEDVVFTHGGRSAHTGGTYLVLRLCAVREIEREFGYDAVIDAIVSHAEQQWRKLAVKGETLRGRLIALVDCAGVSPGTFPATLVARVVTTLDRNYPELAAEVHVVNVWWLVKRGLHALLEATSASTRRRVRIYRNDDTGAEKLTVRFADHALPACLPRGRCACRTCKRMTRAGLGWNETRSRREREFAHGGLMQGGFKRHEWAAMSSAQKRQYARHLLFYALGVATFWPLHVLRLNAHPVLLVIIRTRKMLGEFAVRLRKGDPVAVFVAAILVFTSLAFVVASLAWWAEYGSTLIIQSMRHPPKTWEEAWEMQGLFKRTIGASLEGSLGLESGSLGMGKAGDILVMEDGGWLG